MIATDYLLINGWLSCPSTVLLHRMVIHYDVGPVTVHSGLNRATANILSSLSFAGINPPTY